jgi:thiamine-phosphate pyrophosphorylase
VSLRREAPGRLHVLTDETVQSRWTHEDLALAAAAGGADVVQYREKRDRPGPARLEVARRIVAALKPTGIRCIVNDEVDVALRSGAAGVHLGPRDAAPREVRRRWPGALIGATANDYDRALACDAMAVDYLGVGPVFGTRSKARPAPTLGLGELERITRAVEHPVIAIGAIDASNLRAVLETGVWGVAVLGAVVCRRDPREATAELRAVLDACRDREVPA